MAHELAWKKRNQQNKTVNRKTLLAQLWISEPLISNTLINNDESCPLYQLIIGQPSCHNNVRRLKVRKFVFSNGV